MATSYAFDSYVIRISGGNTGRVGLIMCYDRGSFVGRIDFYPEGAEIPADYLWHSNPLGGSIILHMPMSRFDAVATTVRLEKPLYLHISANRGIGSATEGLGFLATNEEEPVGEQEGTP